MALQAFKEWLVENVGPVRYAYGRLRNRDLWRTIQAERWVRDALGRVRDHDLSDFAFRDGRAYVVTPRGCELLYVPGRPFTTLGLELRDKRFEETELDVLIDLTRHASVTLDIGANCGYMSIVLTKSHPHLRVFAFEPVPSTFDSLVHNCRHNGVSDRVHCEQMAVGECTGTLRMTTRLNTGNYVVSDGRRQAEATAVVPVTTVDEYLASANLARVDGIKCDIEGAELFMVRGATRCIERDRPWLLLEIEERWTSRQGYHGRDLVAELAGLGYIYFLIVKGSSRLVPASDFERDSERTNNFLFVHRDSPWMGRISAE